MKFIIIGTILVIAGMAVGQNRTLDEILSWSAPKELKKQFPYFVSGVDKQGSPVLVVEYGRWDIRALAEKEDEAMIEEYKRYTEQMWARWFHTATEYSTPENKIDSIFCISDLEGFDLRQFSHTQTVRLTLNLMRQFAEAVQRGGKCRKAFIINSNYLFQTVYNLGKPLLGELAEFIVLYGTNKDKWKPILLNEVDKDQLPPWLGGNEGHKPVKVFG